MQDEFHLSLPVINILLISFYIVLELANDCVNILQKKNEALITDDIWIRFMDSKSLFFTRTRQA